MLLLRTQRSHRRNPWGNIKKGLDLCEGLGSGRYPRKHSYTYTHVPLGGGKGDYVKVQDNGEIHKSGMA